MCGGEQVKCKQFGLLCQRLEHLQILDGSETGLPWLLVDNTVHSKRIILLQFEIQELMRAMQMFSSVFPLTVINDHAGAINKNLKKKCFPY